MKSTLRLIIGGDRSVNRSDAEDLSETLRKLQHPLETLGNAKSPRLAIYVACAFAAKNVHGNRVYVAESRHFDAQELCLQ